MATTTSSAENILNQVILVQIEAHIWSGRKKLENADLLNVKADDLPPAYFATMGSKKIINTDTLKIFDTLKKRAHRICESHGVSFLGGYAIPLTKVEVVGAELDLIEVEFEAAKIDFLDKYPAQIDSWIALNQSWAHAIKSSVTAVGRVEAAIGFAWQAIHVKTPKGKAAKILSRGINKEVNGLSDQLFKEISLSAMDMLDKTLVGKNQVTQKSLGRIHQLRQKLFDLSFLNATVKPLVHSIDYILTLMPPSGIIEGESFNALYQLVELLSDPDRAIQHGIEINEGKSVEDAVSEYVLNQKTLTQMAEVKPEANLFTAVTAVTAAIAANPAPADISDPKHGNTMLSENATQPGKAVRKPVVKSAVKSVVEKVKPVIPVPSVTPAPEQPTSVEETDEASVCLF